MEFAELFYNDLFLCLYSNLYFNLQTFMQMQTHIFFKHIAFFEEKKKILDLWHTQKKGSGV